MTKLNYTPVKGKASFINDWPNKHFSLEEARAKSGATGVAINHYLSNTCSIDIDDLEKCIVLFKKNDIDILKECKNSFEVVSPKNNRKKFIYEIPQDIKLEHVATKVLELRCGKHYDVMPDSEYPDGSMYTHAGSKEITLLPQVLVGFWLQCMEFQSKERQASKGTGEVPLISNSSKMSIIHVFNFNHPLETILEECGYKQRNNKWQSPNSESGSYGLTTQMSYLNPWDVCYSHHCSDGDLSGRPIDAFEIASAFTYPDKDVNTAKKQFAAEQAKKLKAIDPDTWEVLSITVAQYNEQVKYRPPVPLLVELADEIYLRQKRPHYKLAVIISIMIAARLSARNYISEWENTPASIYMMLIGSSGIGKELIRELFSLVFRGYIAAFDFHGMPVSKEGLVVDLLNDPAALHIIDEFGLKMKAKDKLFIGIMSLGMELYGRSASNHKQGSGSTRNKTKDEIASDKQTIYNPCPSQICTTTWATLRGAIEENHIGSGLLNRYLILELGDKPERQYNSKSGPLPELFLQRVDKLIEKTVLQAATQEATPTTIPIDDNAKQLIICFDKNTDKLCAGDDELSNLMERRFENIIRLSAILAVWSEEQRITEEIVNFIIEVIMPDCSRVDKLIKNRNYKTSKLDSLIKKLMGYIKEKGKEGTTKTDMAKHCNPFKQYTISGQSATVARDGLLDDMEERDLIVTSRIRINNSKKETRVIHAIEYAPVD